MLREVVDSVGALHAGDDLVEGDKLLRFGDESHLEHPQPAPVQPVLQPGGAEVGDLAEHRPEARQGAEGGEGDQEGVHSPCGAMGLDLGARAARLSVVVTARVGHVAQAATCARPVSRSACTAYNFTTYNFTTYTCITYTFTTYTFTTYTCTTYTFTTYTCSTGR